MYSHENGSTLPFNSKNELKYESLLSKSVNQTVLHIVLFVFVSFFPNLMLTVNAGIIIEMISALQDSKSSFTSPSSATVLSDVRQISAAHYLDT